MGFKAMRRVQLGRKAALAQTLRFAAVLCALLLCLSAGLAQAEPAAALEEGAVYRLTAEQLRTMADAAETDGVVWTEGTLRLAEGRTDGVYVSLAIRLAFFSTLTITLKYDGAETTTVPALAVSVYRPEENGWGEWITIPDGEAAGRTKGTAATLLLRYRLTFTAEAGKPGPVVRSLLVTAEQPLFSRSNLIVLVVMITALVLYLWRKKLQRETAAKR
jgi:hypothetical protein